MSLYQRITIYTSESASWKGQQPGEYVTGYLKRNAVKARCLAWHAQGGYFEDGTTVGSHIEVLAAKMPVKIEIVLSAGSVPQVLADLQLVAHDAIVTLDEMNVVALHTRDAAPALSEQRLVGDIMTRPAHAVRTNTALRDVVGLLLRSEFHGVPVTDEFGILKGIITQRDLIHRAGMPVRLGLLSRLTDETGLDWAAGKSAADVMTAEPVAVREHLPVADAVNLMLRHTLKRLPVVDEYHKVIGMMARFDVLRSAASGRARVLPETAAAAAKTAREAARTCVAQCRPQASFAEVLQAMDANQMQRVAVVDDSGKLLGLIFDHDLVQAFGVEHSRILQYFVERIWRGSAGAPQLAQKNAGELMRTDIASVPAEMPLTEVLHLMAEHGYKRVPVVDAAGRFLGIISRDMLLRAICY